MNPDTWKLVASIGGVLITTVTGPIIWAIRAESGKIRAETKLDIVNLKADLEKKMVEMEARLNQRIDTRLVHK